MIALRKASERHYEKRRSQDVWHTFGPDNGATQPSDAFAGVKFFEEIRLRPGARFLHPPRLESEMIRYVHEGSLVYEDSLGHTGIVQTGEFQRITATNGLRRSETNASRTHSAHIFQIGLDIPVAGLKPGHEQKYFSVAERHGRLCIIASTDARNGSLHTRYDARIYSSILDRGQHLVFELLPGRSAWLHLVSGKALLSDIELNTGDGAGITKERAISLTAHQKSEILLVDLIDRR